jgi:hypothetical protein
MIATVRVYLPSTLPELRRLADDGAVGPAPLIAHAVTPSLREWYAEGNLEELEYAAMADAARASLRLLRADAVASRRRVVIAADVADKSVRPVLGAERSVVRIDDVVPLDAVASIHVDDASAEADVRAAVEALPAADAGDEDAQFVVDGAEGHELLWYARQELPDLVC